METLVCIMNSYLSQIDSQTGNFNNIFKDCPNVVVFIFPSRSPAEELRFGSGENEKKCLIILSNVTKNKVAFKVSRLDDG